ncbi:hypothetical protein BB559_004283 [Furculomyces boomerangus]|uniref:RRM domain-containing protein n=1 Tax=Furculomyces boomerangus TaxID=61424 RepID=A0A2T9YFL1_9FUNG|nr:hypothetical protein BB559_006490 [Furculomyces boomerangus]PVU91138.1 hypothetical protein BB559_004283 [Furculomyces boomerangus]
MFALRSRIAPFASKFLTNSRQFCVKSIYVGNLPWATTEEDLRQSFTAYGNVDSVVIPKYEDGKTKGYGFVSYIYGERPESTELSTPSPPTVEEIDACTKIINNAIDKMNGVEFMGRSLRVSHSQVGGGSDKFKRERRGTGNYQDRREPRNYQDRREPRNYQDRREPRSYQERREPRNYEE